MKKIIIILLSSFVSISANAIPLPDKAHRAYSVIVEAGAKLLEFDIIRENLDSQQKQLVAITDKEKYSLGVGKAISVMLPIEDLAPSFDELVPVFIALQNGLANDSENKANQTEALKGLMAMLESPEVFHTVLPWPSCLKGYKEAMSYPATLKFIKAVRVIAHKLFFTHYCDEKNNFDQKNLSSEAHLFYGIVKQAIVNIFGQLMQNVVQTNVANSLNSSIIRKENRTARTIISSSIGGPPEINELKNTAIANSDLAENTETTELVTQSIVDNSISKQQVQDCLQQAIVNDSTKEIYEAVKAGADVNSGKGGLPPILWAVLLKKCNAVEALLAYGVSYDHTYLGRTLLDFAKRNYDVKSMLSLIKKGLPYDELDIMSAVIELFRHRHFKSYENLKNTNSDSVLELLRELINRGYDVASPNKGGRALLWSIQGDLPDGPQDTEIVELLIKSGVDPNQVVCLGDREETPLIAAVNAHNIPAAKMLLDAGAQISKEVRYFGLKKNAVTALTYAIDQNLTDVIIFLIEHGASL